MLRLLGLPVNRSHHNPGPQLGYVIYSQTLETIQPGFVAKFGNEQFISSKTKFLLQTQAFFFLYYSPFFLLCLFQLPLSFILCPCPLFFSFFLVQHAVFLHAPSACARVLAVQVLSAALFLFLSLCCRRRCNVFHGLNHHPKKMKGFLICPIKMNQVTTGVSCPRRSVLPGIRKCRKRIQVIQAQTPEGGNGMTSNLSSQT